MARATTYVILLRAIGPATHRLMSMEAWRKASAEAGFGDPQTVVATGNMVASFEGTAAEASKAMTVVLRGFGLRENVVPILRRPTLLRRLVAAPIMAAAEARPQEAAVYFFASRQPDLSWAAGYEGPETLDVIKDHLLIDFQGDPTRSGALLRRIDKMCGTSTARNLNTVNGLVRLAANRGKTA